MNLQDFINSISNLSKENKRLFFTAFDAQRADAEALTTEEEQAKYEAYMLRLRTTAGQLFGVTVPENVTVNQIKTYLNDWVNTNEIKLIPLVGNIDNFKQRQISEAEANGDDVEAWLRQSIKINNVYLQECGLKWFYQK